MTTHILNHHVWPDGSANCLYAEQLAESLTKEGIKTVLVGGSGSYRKANRDKPKTKVIQLKTLTLSRNQGGSLIKEYLSVYRAYKKYIKQSVSPNDTVIATSDPFLSLLLVFSLPKTSNKIFWLTDYFPEGLVSVNSYYRLILPLLNLVWNFVLNRWDKVVKISENLNYYSHNAVVYRLWPTISKLKPVKNKPKKWILYTGNMGFVHDLDATIDVAKKYFDQGYQIHFYADGPKMNQLPNWIEKHSTFTNNSDLIQALYDHEIHLIAGTVNSDGGSFPSKMWNSLACGRQITPCGFKNKLLAEYKIAIKSNYSQHLNQMRNFIIDYTK